MLIDTSYFFGSLSIGQVTTPAVNAELTALIKRLEPEYLQKLLGYSLKNDFLNGLQAIPIDSKWTDLLYGKDYTVSGIPARWNGLISLADDVTAEILGAGAYSVVVGRGQTYDPLPGSTTMIIPPAYVGKTLFIEQRGFGELRPDEFDVTGNVVTLLQGFTFSNDDTYFVKTASSLNVTVGVGEKKSPIANYVYYHWMRTHVTASMGSGEVKAKSNSSDNVSPIDKMTAAWNEMVNWNQSLYPFMEYGNFGYGPLHYCEDVYKFKNSLGL
jgi:hypothetical protein